MKMKAKEFIRYFIDYFGLWDANKKRVIIEDNKVSIILEKGGYRYEISVVKDLKGKFYLFKKLKNV